MRIPTLTGTIKRRLLINYRADPDGVARLLPKPFSPKLQRGFAVVGVCLIRFEHERPAGLPAFLGLSSENAAHRFAVEWTDGDGAPRSGVYIPRRDTDSAVNRLVGKRIVPTAQHSARFQATDTGGRVEIHVRSKDGQVAVDVAGAEAVFMPDGSCFKSLDESSSFFGAGSCGYAPSGHGGSYDGIELVAPAWSVEPFAVSEIRSSYFDDPARFPAGSIVFDHALIMRDIAHEWRHIGGLPADDYLSSAAVQSPASVA